MERRKYRTLVVGPPWAAMKSQHDGCFGKISSYPGFKLMSDREVVDFPIHEFAHEQCHLYLWALNSTIRRAFDVLDAWGFKFHCVLVWNKTSGFRPAIFSFCNEFVLFAYRGYLKQKDEVLFVPTHFEAKMRGLGRNPDELYHIAEKVSLPPRVDIFSRESREGWDCWGDEANVEEKEEKGFVLGLPIWGERSAWATLGYPK